MQHAFWHPSFPDAQQAEITTVEAALERFVTVSGAPANADIVSVPDSRQEPKRSEIKLYGRKLLDSRLSSLRVLCRRALECLICKKKKKPQPNKGNKTPFLSSRRIFILKNLNCKPISSPPPQKLHLTNQNVQSSFFF